MNTLPLAYSKTLANLHWLTGAEKEKDLTQETSYCCLFFVFLKDNFLFFFSNEHDCRCGLRFEGLFVRKRNVVVRKAL